MYVTNMKTIVTAKKYSGKWIAWNEDHSKVIASAETLKEVEDMVSKQGDNKVWLDKVPSSQEFYSGAAMFQ